MKYKQNVLYIVSYVQLQDIHCLWLYTGTMYVVTLPSSDNVLFIILSLKFAFYFDTGTHF
jgi:hypothetical protein